MNECLDGVRTRGFVNVQTQGGAIAYVSDGSVKH